MTWFVVVIVVVLVVLTTAAVLGRVDGAIADPTTTLSHEPLPETPLTPADFEELRFDTGLRGYRMGQVDRVIDRLRREISELDEEVARLRTGPLDTGESDASDASGEWPESAAADESPGDEAPDEAPDESPDEASSVTASASSSSDRRG